MKIFENLRKKIVNLVPGPFSQTILRKRNQDFVTLKAQ